MRKVLAGANKLVGWMDFIQFGTSPHQAGISRRQQAEDLRTLLEAVLSDWPGDTPPTPSVTAARDYLQQLRRDEGEPSAPGASDA